jgi:hypothetical protein
VDGGKRRQRAVGVEYRAGAGIVRVDRLTPLDREGQGDEGQERQIGDRPKRSPHDARVEPRHLRHVYTSGDRGTQAESGALEWSARETRRLEAERDPADDRARVARQVVDVGHALGGLGREP